MLLLHSSSLHLHLSYIPFIIHDLSNIGYYMKQSNFCLFILGFLSVHLKMCVSVCVYLAGWSHYMMHLIFARLWVTVCDGS